MDNRVFIRGTSEPDAEYDNKRPDLSWHGTSVSARGGRILTEKPETDNAGMDATTDTMASQPTSTLQRCRSGHKTAGPGKSSKIIPDSQHDEESSSESNNGDSDFSSSEEEPHERAILPSTPGRGICKRRFSHPMASSDPSDDRARIVKRKNQQVAVGHGKNIPETNDMVETQSAELRRQLEKIRKQHERDMEVFNSVINDEIMSSLSAAVVDLKATYEELWREVQIALAETLREDDDGKV
ncbi:hypothetical protein FQN50_002969 [Emmonsiellopsis sp. PD_5]|nr:hypothetical protein FQN50_002969 [Emmonsiellopsis sp. PD_5]